MKSKKIIVKIKLRGQGEGMGKERPESYKQTVINICRELHYNIPPNEISTAHRLKKHPESSGPPGIIVRFKDRDIRKDVLDLKFLLSYIKYKLCSPPVLVHMLLAGKFTMGDLNKNNKRTCFMVNLSDVK